VRLRPRLPRPRLTRRRVLVGAGVLVVGGVAAVVVTRGGGGDGDDGDLAATTVATAESRDLVVADTYEGQLGYGDARSYVTDRAGVVTTVAASGSIVDLGGSLFSVDFEPTVVLRGAVPAYRALDVDAHDGPDVQQLEQALVDLGHGAGVTVDEHFDSGTAAAVKRWEDALDRAEPDGRVELGDVAFAAGPVRVGTITADVGTRVQEGSTVLEATPTEHVVTVDLDASRSNELEPGTKVGLTMPDGAETTGTVATIGSEAESSDDGQEGGGLGPGGGGGPTVPVTITLDDPTAAAGFDTGSVDVAIERSRQDDATAVPVTALLALTEGGYAVQLPGAGEAPGRLVAVEVGTYADGWVGVTGEGLEPGTKVVVPA
jgi:hypothetical protein